MVQDGSVPDELPTLSQGPGPYAVPGQEPPSTTTRQSSKRCLTLQKNKKGERASSKTRTLLGWWGEIVSFALALCCTSLILVILIFIHDRPLDIWPLSIQPNSLVAIFSTITKSALSYPVAECLGQLKWHHFEKTRALGQMDVFDKASRGPWGAFRFIFDIKGGTRLASLGSLITVLMLGFEPFTQQVIRFSPRRVPVQSMSGSITKATSFKVAYTIGGTSQGAFALDTALQSIIARVPTIDSRSAGISTSYCPGAQCVYPSFTTLASCWQCKKTTYQTQSLNCSGSFLWQNRTTTTFGSGDQLRNNVRFFLEALPYSMDMSCSKSSEGFPTIPINMSIVFDHSDGEPMPHIVTARLKPGRNSNFVGTKQAWLASSGLENNKTSFLRGCGPFEERVEETAPPRYSSWTCIQSLTDFSSYSFNNGYGAIDLDKFGQLDIDISQCGLELCAQPFSNNSQTYSPSVQLKLDSDSDGLSFSIPNNATIITNGASEKSASSPANPGNKTNPNNPSAFQTREPIPNTGPFTVHDIAYTRLQQSLRRLANATPTLSGTSATFFDGASTNDDFGPLFNDLSAVVTRYIHSEWNTQRTNVTGAVYTTTVYADVRLEWLVAPLVVMLLAMLFFITTVLRDRSREYLFKTSLLPVLLHGFEDTRKMDRGRGGTQGDEMPAPHDEKKKKKKKKKETQETLLRAAGKTNVVLARNDRGVLKLKAE